MLSAFLCVVEIIRKAHSWLLYNFYIVFTGALGSLLSLVRPSIDMKDCTQTVMFSENGRVFPTCIYGQVLEKKSKLTGSSCCHKWTTAVCTSAIQCPLSIFFSLFLLLLTPVDRKSLPNDTNGNGTSLNWGCFSIYTSLVSLPNTFNLSNSARSFQSTEFSPCWWEGSQDLEITFERIYSIHRKFMYQACWSFPSRI